MHNLHRILSSSNYVCTYHDVVYGRKVFTECSSRRVHASSTYAPAAIWLHDDLMQLWINTHDFFSYTDDARACDSMLQDLCLSCSNGLCNLRLYTADEPCLEQLVSSFLRPLQRLEFSIPCHGSLQERLHTSQILQQCLWWRSFSLHGQREGDGIISYGVRLYPTHTMKLDIFFTP